LHNLAKILEVLTTILKDPATVLENPATIPEVSAKILRSLQRSSRTLVQDLMREPKRFIGS